MLKVTEGTEVALTVETDFLMNTVTNINAHALLSSPSVQVSNFFFSSTFFPSGSL